jgi:hypothetical protein
MFTKSKMAFVAAAVAMTFSAPAFAQSTDHTGTLQPSYYDSTGKQIVGSWAATRRTAKPIVQTRPLYNSAMTPNYIGGGAATSGYDPSIESQR